MRNIETEEMPALSYPFQLEETLAESQFHLDDIILLLHHLRLIYANRNDSVAVLGNMHWFPVEGNSTSMAPDVMVCFGVPHQRETDRRSYHQHLENGVAPSVVFEVRSQSNTNAMTEMKRLWYQTYGVQEFYHISRDPAHVEVFVRENDVLVEQPDLLEWTSDILNIRMNWEQPELRIYTPSGILMRPTPDLIRQQRQTIQRTRRELREQRERASEAERRAEQAEQQAQFLLDLLRQHGIDPTPPNSGNG